MIGPVNSSLFKILSSIFKAIEPGKDPPLPKHRKIDDDNFAAKIAKVCIVSLLTYSYIIHKLIHKNYTFSWIKQILSNTSINIAPTGALIKMEMTEIAKISSPQENPIASGMPPMAACTVAFGM